ncbi:glycosyltransferase family 4 protein [Desulfopila sp. IMCC35008]|uniref:glycosyltransferase family 4 protein n=1 Tax=Desulfopila sp. IMCC35008 TaxID=2653858 RepID=UPI0013CF9842|nr:glycosyltransferase family 4 protein [Desulfopila sp. IMCC35008]
MVIWKYYPSLEGGAERQCRKLVHELTGRGHECTVITAYNEKNLDRDGKGLSGERVIRLGDFAWVVIEFQNLLTSVIKILSPSRKIPASMLFWLSLPFTWLSRLSFMWSAKNYFCKNHSGYDVIHVHEAHWIAGAVEWACQGLDVPIICKEADYPHKKTISYDTPMREKLSGLRKESSFIAITEAIRQSMLATGIGRSRVSLIPNGVEIPEKRASVLESKAIVYIGNLTQGTHRKAFDILFESWVEVQKQRPDLKLIVLGGGDSSVWENYLKEKQCVGSVDFRGSVSDVGSYLQKARLFVLPSRVEGLSNALLEAMSWAVPVIVSDIPTHQSLVQSGVNGIAVPVGDSNALARAIVDLYDNDQLSVSLAIEGRNTIVSEYSIEHVVNLLEELYTGMIREGSSKKVQ